jgi:hypothetical protein
LARQLLVATLVTRGVGYILHTRLFLGTVAVAISTSANRTTFDIVDDEELRHTECLHVEKILRTCNYPFG